jgi:para-nitrobenzyl esterase
MPPVPSKPWNGIRDAFQFGPQAPQLPDLTLGIYPVAKKGTPISEDCLYLNVWTPGLNDGKKRPVMFWIHGGGYKKFSSNSDFYDGVNLCKRGDVVVVTVNHRLNAFGFLYLAKIGGPDYAESGNVGMLDLVLALKWVKVNINEFGGDPNNVTIFGESGGGEKCTTLMEMPSAVGLINRVIAESGQQITVRTPEEATESAVRVLKRLNISPKNINEIKNIPMKKIIDAMQNELFIPVRDGIVLPKNSFGQNAPALSANIPLMIGSNHDETTLFIGLADSTTFNLTWNMVAPKIKEHIHRFIGNIDPNIIVKRYRQIYPNYSPTDVFFAATTAIRTWKGMVIETERRARQNGAPTYVYQLNWRAPVDGGKWRTPHGLDIPLVFDNIKYGASMIGTGSEAQKMADIMSEAWIAFARTGNPNIPHLPYWPSFDLKNRAAMVFDVVPKLVSDPRSEERKFIEHFKYVQP